MAVEIHDIIVRNYGFALQRYEQFAKTERNKRFYLQKPREKLTLPDISEVKLELSCDDRRTRTLCVTQGNARKRERGYGGKLTDNVSTRHVCVPHSQP